MPAGLCQVEKMIEVSDVPMRFRMANDRINSIKEYLVQRVKGKLHYNDFEALRTSVLT